MGQPDLRPLLRANERRWRELWPEAFARTSVYDGWTTYWALPQTPPWDADEQSPREKRHGVDPAPDADDPDREP